MSVAQPAHGAEPAQICYGMRVGIRSAIEPRYIAAYPDGSEASDEWSLEVSGYHPFRTGDVVDRAVNCPSEWLLFNYSNRSDRGPVSVGDVVCFAKELAPLAAKRKERYMYLALALADGNVMKPAFEKAEASPQGTDLCCWTLVHAGGTDESGTQLQVGTQLKLRGKYSNCLAVGRPMWEVQQGGKKFLAPSRRRGYTLACSPRNARAEEQCFCVVRAGLPCQSSGQIPSIAQALPPEPAKNVDSFHGMALQQQEQALLEDVLSCFLGVDGIYIRQEVHDRPGISSVRYVLRDPPGADASTVQFFQKLLPVCENHTAVARFIKVHSQHEYGMVNHALCAALGDLMQEFTAKVGELETMLRNGTLTIAKLWYYIQPSLDTLSVLERVVSQVYGCIGGQVLNGIGVAMSKSSLRAAQNLYEFLLQRAVRPYLEMVAKWVCDGRLEDPYGEFFISENTRSGDDKAGMPGADFWQRHFTMEEAQVPHFLQGCKDKVLHAGKYLHVFSSSAPSFKLQEPSQRMLRALLIYSARRQDYMDAVDAAYRRASAALLELFMKEAPEGLDLPGRLSSMRCFFFLSRADWFGQFMDTATQELERPAAEVPLARLEGLLDMALRTSSVAHDPSREDIACSLHNFRIEDACQRMTRAHSATRGDELDDDDASERSARSTQPMAASISRGSDIHTAEKAVAATGGGGGAIGPASETSGVRCFTLKYLTSWPLSIVFSRALLLKYQVIFRHLLYCRYVERKLVEVWVDHQSTKVLGLDKNFSPSYTLRQRMLHFCRDYIYYAMVEVLEPQSHSFLASLESAETLDAVLLNHERFLDTCLREILLTERENLYKQLSRLLGTCLTFASNMHHFAADGQTTGPRTSPAGPRWERAKPDFQPTYLSSISKFKEIFETQLQGFLSQIRRETTHRYEHFLSNMLTRLDYNDYYSGVFGHTGAAAASGDLHSLG